MHLGLDALVELPLALGDDLGVDVRPQVEGRRIDGLVFLLDPDGEGRLHESWQLAVCQLAVKLPIGNVSCLSGAHPTDTSRAQPAQSLS